MFSRSSQHIHNLRVLVFQFQMVRDDIFLIFISGIHHRALPVTAHIKCSRFYSRRIPRLLKGRIVLIVNSWNHAINLNFYKNQFITRSISVVHWLSRFTSLILGKNIPLFLTIRIVILAETSLPLCGCHQGRFELIFDLKSPNN